MTEATAACSQGDALLRFVNDKLLADVAPAMAIDTPLFEDDRIDSLKLLQLIAFVEEHANRPIPDEFIVKERFRTIGTIAENFLES